MFQKLASSGRLLRSLAGAGDKATSVLQKLPKKRFIAGMGLMAGAHAVGKGLDKAKEYEAGFAPGVAENRLD
jgi:hypothetical protein